MEATAGIEPAIGVLQTPALTTWPRRQIKMERKTRFELATFSLANRNRPVQHRSSISTPDDNTRKSGSLISRWMLVASGGPNKTVAELQRKMSADQRPRARPLRF